MGLLLALARILVGGAIFLLVRWHLGRRAHREHIANCIRRQLI